MVRPLPLGKYRAELRGNLFLYPSFLCSSQPSSLLSSLPLLLRFRRRLKLHGQDDFLEQHRSRRRRVDSVAGLGARRCRRLYVGCDVGGFYVSSDAGHSYAIHNQGLDDRFVERIAAAVRARHDLPRHGKRCIPQ